MSVAVCIPFRDRGVDPLRAANLKRVLEHWADYGAPIVIASDGRTHDAQFNRSAAYNRAAALTDATTLVYTESDMLIDFTQIDQAVELAQAEPGLVVPFDEYRYLSETDSELVRQGGNPAWFEPESVISKDTRSFLRTGPINVLTRATLQAIGQWDEHFEGCWWDDRAMNHAFTICTQPTRHVPGPAYHLYHLPGWTGQHLTTEDKQATERNKQRWHQYQQATTPAHIRALTQ